MLESYLVHLTSLDLPANFFSGLYAIYLVDFHDFSLVSKYHIKCGKRPIWVYFRSTINISSTMNEFYVIEHYTLS